MMCTPMAMGTELIGARLTDSLYWLPPKAYIIIDSEETATRRPADGMELLGYPDLSTLTEPICAKRS